MPSVGAQRIQLHRCGLRHVDEGVGGAIGLIGDTHLARHLCRHRIVVEFPHPEPFRQRPVEGPHGGAVDGQMVGVASDPGRPEGQYHLGTVSADGFEHLPFQPLGWDIGEAAIRVAEALDLPEADRLGGRDEIQAAQPRQLLRGRWRVHVALAALAASGEQSVEG